jgi:hypothetical protein
VRRRSDPVDPERQSEGRVTVGVVAHYLDPGRVGILGQGGAVIGGYRRVTDRVDRDGQRW